jgi:hypothetical protein
MSWQIVALAILMAVGGGLSGLALGWSETESKQRFFAAAALLPVITVSFIACIWLYFAWPSAWGILTSLGILTVGALIVYLLVSKIIPSKVEPTSSMR